MAKKKSDCCAFCGRPANQSEVLVPSAIAPDVYICAECADSIHEILRDFRGESASGKEKASGNTPSLAKIPKPKEICEYLDQY
ncbi:MAG: ATP-dependent Clp protease ATP-binding subunit ClpX, partial [Muribaculaceae bacterium]|nr:ATP-dependent Clp protease ATP-binding subunit ClpX [Muribaculaceae bacterium]